MTSQFLNLAFLVMTILSAGCGVRQAARSAAAGESGALNRREAQRVPAEACELLSGNWGAFETPDGVAERMCGELPCGYVGPFKLECRDGAVTGSVLLFVDSTTGETSRAPLDITWSENRLEMKFRNSQSCPVTYEVSISGQDLVGRYSKNDCGGIKQSGKLLARKGPLRWLKKPS